MTHPLPLLLALLLPVASYAGPGAAAVLGAALLTGDSFEPREAWDAEWHGLQRIGFLPGGCLTFAEHAAAKFIATGHRAHVHVCEDPDEPDRGHALVAWQTSDPQARLGSWWVMELYTPDWALVYRPKLEDPCRDWRRRSGPLPGMYNQGLDPMPIDGMLGMAKPPGKSAAYVSPSVPVRKGPLPPPRTKLRLGRLRDVDPYTGLDDRSQPSLVRYDDTGQQLPEWRAKQLAFWQELQNRYDADWAKAVERERVKQAAHIARMEAAKARLALRSANMMEETR